MRRRSRHTTCAVITKRDRRSVTVALRWEACKNRWGTIGRMRRCSNRFRQVEAEHCGTYHQKKYPISSISSAVWIKTSIGCWTLRFFLVKKALFESSVYGINLVRMFVGATRKHSPPNLPCLPAAESAYAGWVCYVIAVVEPFGGFSRSEGTTRSSLRKSIHISRVLHLLLLGNPKLVLKTKAFS